MISVIQMPLRVTMYYSQPMRDLIVDHRQIGGFSNVFNPAILVGGRGGAGFWPVPCTKH
jgi:hypothetical protein